jgi:hypothetical protein
MRMMCLVDLLGLFALAGGLIAVIFVVVALYAHFAVKDCKSVLSEHEKRWLGE